MSPQDVNNISSWLQELLRLQQDTHTQLVDMRNENRQVMDEIKSISARMDKKDTEIIRYIEALKGQIDILKGDVAAAKSAAENTNSHVDSKLSDIKSTLNEIRRAV